MAVFTSVVYFFVLNKIANSDPVRCGLSLCFDVGGTESTWINHRMIQITLSQWQHPHMLRARFKPVALGSGEGK